MDTPEVYYDNNNDDEDEGGATARAVAAIESQLQLFTSPLLMEPASQSYGSSKYLEGNAPSGGSSSHYYEMDEWMSHELREDPLASKPAKRTPMLERADTPVISNKAGHIALTPAASYGDDDDDDDEDDDDGDGYDNDVVMTMPVETPLLQRQFRPAPSTGSAGAKKVALKLFPSSLSSSSSSLNQLTFRRYHDALWGYHHAKSSVTHRFALEQEERRLEALTLDSTDAEQPPPTLPNASALAQQESRVEMDYCKTLSQLAYSLQDESAQEEGHLWRLLTVLRKLGLAALLWNDDSTSSTQNASAQVFFLQHLSTKVHATPKELLEALEPPTAGQTMTRASFSSPPLALQRKYQLVRWIQACLEEDSKSAKKILPSKVLTSPSYPDDPSLPTLVSESDAIVIKDLLEACLSMVLEGRLDAARDLARSHGQSWRAAAWLGGEPAGYLTVTKDDAQTVDRVPIGNPNRFLWKRRVWKTGQRLASQRENEIAGPGRNEEAAIYSILANDVATALANPCLRTSWNKSLCVLLMGVWGRVQDEALYRHNNNRRRNVRPPYPGSQYEQEEKEQMVATGELFNMTESQMAAKLQSSRFLQQQQQQRRREGQVSYRTAMLSFIVGRSAILDFCRIEATEILSNIKQQAEKHNPDYDSQVDWRGLRFLTHLTLFLDSLKDSTTPVVLDGLTGLKDELLFAYVLYIESRPDLWHMFSLYVSFLPPPQILEYYPPVLVKVVDDDGRSLMMDQIRQLMPALELPLFCKVVRSSLTVSRLGRTEDSDTLDDIKCSSLYWLLQYEEHLGDALICANILLRQFLLSEHEDKIDVATEFVSKYLLEDLVDRAGQTLPPGLQDEFFETTSDSTHATVPNPRRSMYETRVSNARAEHLAYITYLDAYKPFGIWKDVLKMTPVTVQNHEMIDKTNLNPTEQEIARQSFRRGWIREKKRDFDNVLEAAEAARLSLHNVLTYPGGWLSTDDEESPNALQPGDNEDVQRQRDIVTIRSRHLVLAVNLYHQVCKDTASWMSRSLDDAGTVGATRDQAQLWLEGEQDRHSSSSSVYSPDFWYQRALDLTTLVADDAYGIHKAFGPSDMMDFLVKVEETAVSQLMNSSTISDV